VRLLVLIPSGLCVIVACSGPSQFGGPCGGGQFAEAHAILPDTGINAGDTLSVGFIQHDTNERSELVIWHLWPFSIDTTDAEPDPRVRIVRDDGSVLLDAIGSRYNQPENQYNMPTWYVHRWIHDAALRNALYEGFQGQRLWIELWRVGAPRLGTRIRLVTDRVGVRETSICV
jgi:hypothetical protein